MVSHLSVFVLGAYFPCRLSCNKNLLSKRSFSIILILVLSHSRLSFFLFNHFGPTIKNSFEQIIIKHAKSLSWFLTSFANSFYTLNGVYLYQRIVLCCISDFLSIFLFSHICLSIICLFFFFCPYLVITLLLWIFYQSFFSHAILHTFLQFCSHLIIFKFKETGRTRSWVLGCKPEPL